MEKRIIISTDTFLDLDSDNQLLFQSVLENLCNSGNKVCFVSRNLSRITEVKNTIKPFNELYFKTRREILNALALNNNNKNFYLVVGSKNKDFEMAVNNKLLYLVPTWNAIKEDKAIKYGIMFDDISTFDEIIKSLNNQNNWYYDLTLPDKTHVYSLMCAHSRTADVTMDEKILVEGFESFLKRGNGTYYKILLCHFLAFMSNNPDFRDIDTWGIMPSSTLILNDDMLRFKEIVRCFMKGQVPRSLLKTPQINNVFLRSHQVQKSHNTNEYIRKKNGSTIHLDSIYINDAYVDARGRNKLIGKNVCIFDDYLTHGNSFEALRNMLKAAGANKIIFVSLGRFRKDYLYQNYEISGDLFKPNGFQYKLIDKQIAYGEYNNEARSELRSLNTIFPTFV